MIDPSMTVAVAFWLHDRYCHQTGGVRYCCQRHARPTTATRLAQRQRDDDWNAFADHLMQDGWIDAAADLIALTREVDQ